MPDPLFLHNLAHTRPIADLFAQLTRLYPEVTFEAVLPLLAARLVGAEAANEDDDPEPEPELISA